MLNQAEFSSTLKSIPWFFDLSSGSLKNLASIAEFRTFSPGDVIYAEGDQHPYMYIILEGKVSLESYVPGRGKLSLSNLEYLDVLGWSSMTPVVRQKNSTARAVENTKLLAFNGKLLMEICEKDSDLGFIIMRRLANIVASHMLNHRLRLMELLSCQID